MRYRHQIVATLNAIGFRKDGGELRADANETLLFERQLEAVQTEIVETEYPALRALDFIPLRGGIDPAAEDFVWYEADSIGQAKIIANYADDLPNITRFMKRTKSPIRTGGDSYHYSVIDVRRAAKEGIPLESQLGRAAREAMLRLHDNIFALGDSTRGIPGFANNALVPILSSGLTGSWSSATPEEILADLFVIQFAVWSQSKQTHRTNRILLPTALYVLVATTILTDSTTGETVLSAFLKAQPPGAGVTVDAWDKLDTAGADSGPRAVAYEVSPQNLFAVRPTEFEQLPPQARDLMFAVPCISRVGGTVWERPLAGVYVDALG